jgi:hypothetical protein
MTIRNLALATAVCAVLSAAVSPLLADANDEPALRPERAVVPQIVIPLSRKARPVAPAPSQPARGAAASAGIGDAVARCEAQVSAAERASCRTHLAREGMPR